MPCIFGARRWRCSPAQAGEIFIAFYGGLLYNKTWVYITKRALITIDEVRMLKIRGRISLVLAFLLAGTFVTQVWATSISDIKKQQSGIQKELQTVNSQLSDLESYKQGALAELDELDAQLVELMMSIDVLENDIKVKEGEIEQAQKEYDAAREKEERQYDAMKKRIRFMYEKGDTMYLEVFLEAKSFADMLNKYDYVEKLYEYDRKLLENYKAAKEEVKEKEEKLIAEKSEMDVMLEDLNVQQNDLNAMISETKATVSDYDTKISSARAQAKQYQALINEQNRQIRQLEEAERKRQEEERKRQEEERKRQEEERKRQEEEAKKKQEESGKSNEAAERSESSGSSSSSSSSTTSSSASSSSAGEVISGSSGSATGKEIANFACRYVGYPYVPGGTSLTEGADCSGFTQTVFRNFGISIPRTSGSQYLGGTPVDYANAEPGDLICYSGHVGIYIGGGKIVHASSPATGIKISYATYRTILGVRRYV